MARSGATCRTACMSYSSSRWKGPPIRLRRRGAGPEVPVGVLMDASIEIVIAVLAILKAGGAYLALDHKQPALRLREIIGESRLALAVTTSSNGGYQAIAGELDFVCLDLAALRIDAESTLNLHS